MFVDSPNPPMQVLCQRVTMPLCNKARCKHFIGLSDVVQIGAYHEGIVPCTIPPNGAAHRGLYGSSSGPYCTGRMHTVTTYVERGDRTLAGKSFEYRFAPCARRSTVESVHIAPRCDKITES